MTTLNTPVLFNDVRDEIVADVESKNIFTILSAGIKAEVSVEETIAKNFRNKFLEELKNDAAGLSVDKTAEDIAMNNILKEWGYSAKEILADEDKIALVVDKSVNRVIKILTENKGNRNAKYGLLYVMGTEMGILNGEHKVLAEKMVDYGMKLILINLIDIEKVTEGFFNIYNGETELERVLATSTK